MSQEINDLEMAALPNYVRERWPLAEARAQRKVAAAKENPAARKLLAAARRASTLQQRIVWLHRAATAWSEPLESVSACRNGCSHCCHTPVVISRAEADILAKAAGRAASSPVHSTTVRTVDDLKAMAEAQEKALEQFEPSPCPFLRDGRCAVYQSRPAACRLLLNLDDDDLLCRLEPGLNIPVPYAGTGEMKLLFLMAQPNVQLADIRDFFPNS